MKKLSASEAIGPAWEHTRLVMSAPFRWRRYLTLVFVALIAQMASSGFSAPFNFPNLLRLLSQGGGFQGSGFKFIPTGLTATVVLAIIASVMLGTLLGLALFYIASRMQFVLFDMVATRQTTIAPLWKKYGTKTWRWIGLKLILGFGCFLVMCILLIFTLPFFIGGVMHLMHSSETENVVGAVGVGLALSIIALIIGALLCYLVLSIILSLLHDFTLPYIALEDLRIGAALRRLEHFVKEAPGEVTLYLLLKFALRIAMGIVGSILLLFAMLISAIPFAVIGVPMYLALHGHGMAANILLCIVVAIAALLLFAWMFVLSAAIFGYMYVFLQSYALYFMGGRYPLLGNLLEPPIVPPAQPQPVMN